MLKHMQRMHQTTRAKGRSLAQQKKDKLIEKRLKRKLDKYKAHYKVLQNKLRGIL